MTTDGDHRRGVLNGEHIRYPTGGTQQYLRRLRRYPRGCTGDDRHVHLPAQYPPKMPVTTLVNSLKGVPGTQAPPVIPRRTRRYRRAPSEA
jgi:REP element-mobilizing transposase RayT